VALVLVMVLAALGGLAVPAHAHHRPGHNAGPPGATSTTTTTVATTTTKAPTTTTTAAPSTTTTAPPTTTTTSKPTTTTTAPSTSTTAPRPPGEAPAADALRVDPTLQVGEFGRDHLGIALANWTFTRGWGKPLVGDVQGLAPVMREIKPGVIRYAGGLWANSVGWDRANQRTAYTMWQRNGNTYWFHYGADELRSLHAFAEQIDADVMIQVNVRANDPGMWADLVAWARDNGFSRFRYYELGNEFDLVGISEGNAPSPAVYAQRVRDYRTAMLGADPTIKIVAGVPATATDIIRQNWAGGGGIPSAYITRPLTDGVPVDAVSYHWYQLDGGGTAADVARWTWGISTGTPDWWRESYTRSWAQRAPAWLRSTALAGRPDVELHVSELGVDSANGQPINGNHLAALWYSEVLGAKAAGGADVITQWDSYAAAGEHWSLVYPHDEHTTSPTLHLRPTFLAYLMYARWFGSEMVATTAPDPQNLTVWAALDGDRLTLRVTNMTGQPITRQVHLGDWFAAGADIYELSSTNPTATSSASATSAAPSTINGIRPTPATLGSPIPPQKVTVNANAFTRTFPAWSSTAIVLEPQRLPE
jgi:hypothetical protein